MPDITNGSGHTPPRSKSTTPADCCQRCGTTVITVYWQHGIERSVQPADSPPGSDWPGSGESAWPDCGDFGPPVLLSVPPVLLSVPPVLPSVPAGLPAADPAPDALGLTVPGASPASVSPVAVSPLASSARRLACRRRPRV